MKTKSQNIELGVLLVNIIAASSYVHIGWYGMATFNALISIAMMINLTRG